MTRQRIAISVLFIVLLLFTTVVSASETQSPGDGSTTVRVSTSADGNLLGQLATDAPGAASQPSWVGLFILLFGGLLAGLWLVVTLLSAMEAIDEKRRTLPLERSRSPNLNRRDEAVPAD